MIFRRVFERLARGVEWVFGTEKGRGDRVVVTVNTAPGGPGPGEMTIKLSIRRSLRAFLIFSFTTTLHILLMYRLTLHPNPLLASTPISEIHSHPIFDPSILKFFLLQPLLLLVEYALIKPLFTRVLPGFSGSPYLARNAIRIWAWCALIWTGRYWSDVWISRGLWMEREKVIGVSVVRGVWEGRWIV